LQSIPALLARAGLFPGARLLDAGCGPGHLAACASLLGARSTGADFSVEMIAEARRRFPAIRFEQGDVEALPFADESQDAVLSNIVLFHVTDPFGAMQEAFRVLVPGGTFAFSQWLGPERSVCYRVLFDVLGAEADLSRSDPAPDAFALSDEARAGEMMRAAGFEDISAEQVPNVLHAPGPSFFDFFMKFGVRVPLLIDRQDEAVRQRIRREIDAQAARYLSDGVYRVPMPSLVVSGKRPVG
jgi:ubiquinone/menaquinone biosynthesis C-methylase UbiE